MSADLDFVQGHKDVIAALTYRHKGEQGGFFPPYIAHDQTRFVVFASCLLGQYYAELRGAAEAEGITLDALIARMALNAAPLTNEELARGRGFGD